MKEVGLREAIKLVLAAGLTVANDELDTWVGMEGDKASVDGFGNEPIEEDFDDVAAAIEYFLKIQARAQ